MRVREVSREYKTRFLSPDSDSVKTECCRIQPYRETNKPSIYVHPNRIDKNKLLGTATITFENGESAAKAIQKFHGKSKKKTW